MRIRETMKQILIVFIVFTIFPQIVGAFDTTKEPYQYVLRSWDTDDGLPQNSILSIVQDREGYMWLGTFEGVVRFDGVKFKVFNKNNTDAIKSNEIQSLYIDKANVLWIASYGGGVVRYKDGTFLQIGSNEKEKELRIWDISGNSDGLWIAAHSGLYNYKNGYFKKYGVKDGFPVNNVLTVYAEEDGTVWAATDNGLVKFKGGKVRLYTKKDGLVDDRVTSMRRDSSGVLWIATKEGVSAMKKGAFINYSSRDGLPGEDITTIYKDRDGVLWFGTSNHGLFRKIGSKFQSFRRSEGLTNDNVQAFLEDREKNLWIGTVGGGLNRLKNGIFVTYSKFHAFRDGMLFNIYEDMSKNLWISTYHGVVKYRNGDFLLFKKDGPEFGKKAGTMLQRRSGEIIVSMGDGLYSFKNGKFRSMNSILEYKNEKITALMEDSKNGLWVGSRAGLKYIKNDKLIHFWKTDGPGGDVVRDLVEDKKGGLWIATDSGLSYYLDGKFKNYTKKEGLSNNKIMSLYLDSDGALWIGTYQGGLNKLYRGKFSSYTSGDGVADDVAYVIMEDSSGRLWMSGNKGVYNVKKSDLALFDRKKISKIPSRLYGENDGLKGNECNGGSKSAGTKDSEGKIWFPTIKGPAFVDPESKERGSFIPPVYIEKVVINDRKIDTNENIILEAGEGKIEIHYTAISYSDPERVKFLYKLEGFDEKWIDPGERRVAFYTNIAPGKYVFKVKAASSDGVWNKKGASVKLMKTPYFHQTKLFYFFIAIAAFIVAYLVFKLRIRHLNRKQKELEERKESLEIVNRKLQTLDKMKDEFLANTSHELRTPLNGIIGLAESLIDGVTGQLNRKTVENLRTIVYSGKRLSALVNDILDFSRLKSSDVELDLKSVDMQQIVDIVFILSKPLLTGKNIELKNNIQGNLTPVYGDENRLQQIMHNLIGNAIKFTDRGKVSVSGRDLGDMIEITVRDTGCGIDPDKLDIIFHGFEQGGNSDDNFKGGTGLGLSITKKLVELHGGTIDVISEFGKGSVFTISFLKSSEEESVSIVEPDLLNSEKNSGKIRLTTINPEIDAEFFIFVVDDEVINQQVLINHLSLNKYRVDTASSGREALEYLNRGEKPDLMLLDVMMPGMNGYEACRRVREIYSQIDLPIILLTAKNQDSDLVQGFDVGANDYLVKPFSKTALLARIRMHIKLSKINQAYSRFVPRQLLNFLDKDSVVDIKLGDQIEKKMTVLFADIRSFTTLSEAMSPQENFNFINSYLKRMGPIIRESGGFIDKYIGDSIMALFPDNPEDAVIAAVELQKEVVRYNHDRAKCNYRPIKIGVGINTTELMLGTIGDKERMEGTVISDGVNLGARMEGLSRHFNIQIAVSEETLLSLSNPDKFSYRYLGNVKMKGKKNFVSIFEIFSGEDSGSIDKKNMTKSDFEEAVMFYYKKEFKNSIELLSKVLEVNPDDKTALYYLKRSELHLKNGVPEEWEAGIMENK